MHIKCMFTRVYGLHGRCFVYRNMRKSLIDNERELTNEMGR